MSVKQEYKPKKTKMDYFCKKVDDWEQVKNDFINGHLDEEGKRQFPTYQQLADKYQVAIGTLYNKASQGKWAKIRTLTQTKLKERREVNELRSIISESATYEAIALEIIYKLFRISHASLQRYADLYDRDVQINKIDPNDIPDIDVKELQTLASLTKELVGLTRKIIGDDESNNIASSFIFPS